MARPSRSDLLDKVMRLEPKAFAYKAGYRDGGDELVAAIQEQQRMIEQLHARRRPTGRRVAKQRTSR